MKIVDSFIEDKISHRIIYCGHVRLRGAYVPFQLIHCVSHRHNNLIIIITLSMCQSYIAEGMTPLLIKGHLI